MMPSIRLNRDIRNAIVRDLIRFRFDAAAGEIAAREANLAAKVYEAAYTASTRKKMADLPSGWLPERSSFSAHISGRLAVLRFSGSRIKGLPNVLPDAPKRRFRSEDSGAGVMCVIETANPLAKEYEEFERDKDSLREKIREASRAAEAVVWSCQTISRLVEAWPEIEPFTRQWVGNSAPLPAVMTDRLNEIFELPVDSEGAAS